MQLVALLRRELGFEIKDGAQIFLLRLAAQSGDLFDQAIDLGPVDRALAQLAAGLLAQRLEAVGGSEGRAGRTQEQRRAALQLQILHSARPSVSPCPTEGSQHSNTVQWAELCDQAASTEHCCPQGHLSIHVHFRT